MPKNNCLKYSFTVIYEEKASLAQDTPSGPEAEAVKKKKVFPYFSLKVIYTVSYSIFFLDLFIKILVYENYHTMYSLMLNNYSNE